ncbi:hypothetical protein GCM10009775_33760 [Microbacterium aoyamense]|uniref:N-acetyltransferase domain-containing protein n=1 Tax=Microbacterium aoyamense TaxID=344166 RepID=A0ABN2PZ03_9MICO|nr:GNAT family N-acetyltransferase [Microbacterium aoyamense]
MPEVRRIRADEASAIRELRLGALLDPAADIAFLETRAQAAARDDDFWEDRAVSGATSERVAQFVAETDAGLVGTVTVLRPEPGAEDYFGRANPSGRAQMVAVYVADDHRGTGLLGELFAAGEAWAAGLGSAEFSLDTHVRNMRAQQAYRKLGYEPTGRTIHGPIGLEIEMLKRP